MQILPQHSIHLFISRSASQSDKDILNEESVPVTDYGYHHYQEPNQHRRGSGDVGGASDRGGGVNDRRGSGEMGGATGVTRDRPGSINDGYDHLGQKPKVKPTGIYLSHIQVTL